VVTIFLLFDFLSSWILAFSNIYDLRLTLKDSVRGDGKFLRVSDMRVDLRKAMDVRVPK
jgi:hypothetical protein